MAGRYDSLYDSPAVRESNRQLVDRLTAILRPMDRVLDLGCGTGFLLDHITWPTSQYLGVDPSEGMCDQFLRKHPDHTVINSCLTEGMVNDFKPTLILALHAVGDHLASEDIDLVAQHDYFVMFSQGEITDPSNPLYNNVERIAGRDKNIEQLEGKKEAFDDSYLIVSNRR